MYFTRTTAHITHALAAIFLIALAGCGTGGGVPRTYAVQGKLQYKDGTPVTSGVIEFVAQGAPVTARGDVGGDGSFVLETLFSGGKQKGAVAGKHRATYIPVQGSQQGVAPVIMPKLYTVAPQEQNEIVIEIDRPKKS